MRNIFGISLNNLTISIYLKDQGVDMNFKTERLIVQFWNPQNLARILITLLCPNS